MSPNLKSFISLACLNVVLAANAVNVKPGHVLSSRDVPPIVSDLTLNSKDRHYYLNLTLGTPPKAMNMALDTGSRDIMVMSSTNPICANNNCSESFDYTQSTTFEYIGPGMRVAYVTQVITGEWAADTIAIGGASANNIEFGLATGGDSELNILGVGFPQFETGQYVPTNTTLQNFAAAGMISSASMALRLADPAQVIMGGLDTSAFYGNLTALPIVSNSSDSNHYGVSVQSIALPGVSTPQSVFPMVAAVDCGAQTMMLPEVIANSFFTKYGMRTISAPSTDGEPLTIGVASCATFNQSTDALTIELAGLQVAIPVSTLASPVTDAVAARSQGRIQSGDCLSLVASVSGQGFIPAILGVPFLNQVYAVFNQESLEIAFAPLSGNTGQSPTIESISSGGATMNGIAANSNATAPTAPPSSGSQNSSKSAAANARAVRGFVVGALIASIVSLLC